jgi:hypothetical protein
MGRHPSYSFYNDTLTYGNRTYTFDHTTAELLQAKLQAGYHLGTADYLLYLEVPDRRGRARVDLIVMVGWSDAFYKPPRWCQVLHKDGDIYNLRATNLMFRRGTNV